MWQLLPPTALLLLDLPKAVVLLDPPWDRVLKDDSVTLRCQGTYPPGDNSTQWLLNGNLISNQDPSYLITEAIPENSGEYRCQTKLSTLSDPVQLRVHAGWLVLQSHRWVYQEGEPIQLRCHSWKNQKFQKVTYLQDGVPKKFFHNNSNLYIPKAALSDNGSYFCRGLIGIKNESSESVDILVQGTAVPSISVLSPPWHQIAFCLLMGVLFAVDTGLYLSMQRHFRSSVGRLENHQTK
nr:low affinity immunoglobulin gamma Fc region receptor III-B isoform X3 [Dasypus novemcinctus]